MASWFCVSLYQNENRLSDGFLAPPISRKDRAHFHDKRHASAYGAIFTGERERPASMGNIVVCGIFRANRLVRPCGERARKEKGEMDKEGARAWKKGTIKGFDGRQKDGRRHVQGRSENYPRGKETPLLTP